MSTYYVSMVTFPAVFATLYVGHMVGDHWVQTHRQACTKGDRGPDGTAACLAHVVTLTLTKLAAFFLLWVFTGWCPTGLTAAGALLADAVSHYWADRRYTLARLAERIGKGGFYRLGQPRSGRDDAPHLGTGAYAMDQSWHIAWLFVTALIIAGGAPT